MFGKNNEKKHLQNATRLYTISILGSGLLKGLGKFLKISLIFYAPMCFDYPVCNIIHELSCKCN